MEGTRVRKNKISVSILVLFLVLFKVLTFDLKRSNHFTGISTVLRATFGLGCAPRSGGNDPSFFSFLIENQFIKIGPKGTTSFPSPWDLSASNARMHTIW